MRYHENNNRFKCLHVRFGCQKKSLIFCSLPSRFHPWLKSFISWKENVISRVFIFNRVFLFSGWISKRFHGMQKHLALSDKFKDLIEEAPSRKSLDPLIEHWTEKWAFRGKMYLHSSATTNSISQAEKRNGRISISNLNYLFILFFSLDSLNVLPAWKSHFVWEAKSLKMLFKETLNSFQVSFLIFCYC